MTVVPISTITDTPTPTDTQVHMRRATFERIKGLRTRVAETTVTLDRASREKKEAQEAFNAATMNLSSAVSDMLDEINGIAKLPLFENMSDAIAKAEADPIAQKLIARMLDHGITSVNTLIVAGYDEAQRLELATYLDALDAHKQAEASGAAQLPELPALPAFLAPGAQSPEEIASLVARLADQGLTMTPEHVSALTNDQWIEVDTWLSDCERIKAEKGDALVMDDLPPAPSYLVRPAEVLATPEATTPSKRKRKTKPVDPLPEVPPAPDPVVDEAY
jgi:hypothetical protein